MPKSKDDLSPANKDPVEGGRTEDADPPATGPNAREESHLGAGGDAAEGEPDVSQA